MGHTWRHSHLSGHHGGHFSGNLVGILVAWPRILWGLHFGYGRGLPQIPMGLGPKMMGLSPRYPRSLGNEGARGCTSNTKKTEALESKGASQRAFQ